MPFPRSLAAYIHDLQPDTPLPYKIFINDFSKYHPDQKELLSIKYL